MSCLLRPVFWHCERCHGLLPSESALETHTRFHESSDLALLQRHLAKGDAPRDQLDLAVTWYAVKAQVYTQVLNLQRVCAQMGEPQTPMTTTNDLRSPVKVAQPTALSAEELPVSGEEVTHTQTSQRQNPWPAEQPTFTLTPEQDSFSAGSVSYTERKPAAVAVALHSDTVINGTGAHEAVDVRTSVAPVPVQMFQNKRSTQGAQLQAGQAALVKQESPHPAMVSPSPALESPDPANQDVSELAGGEEESAEEDAYDICDDWYALSDLDQSDESDGGHLDGEDGQPEAPENTSKRKRSEDDNEPEKSQNSEHRCRTCDTVYSYRRGLARHMWRVHGEDITTRWSGSPVLRRYHELRSGTAFCRTEEGRLLRGARGFWCRLCAAGFTDRERFCAHFERRHGAACCVCQTEYQSVRACAAHVRQAHPELLLRCPDCALTFTRKLRLCKHFYRQHVGGEQRKKEEKIQCEICRKDVDEYKMKGHLQMHAACFCYLCNRNFDNKRSFAQHRRQVHREFNLQDCDICHKKFAKIAELLAHYVDEHQDKIPAETCQYCGVKYPCKFTKKHKDICPKFPRKPRAKDTCEICGKSVTRMEEHMRLHTGVTPFKCDICDKGFKYISNLKSHIRTHSDRKDFVCDICDKRFKLSSTLSNHKRVHSEERNHVCELCGAGFKQEAALKTHKWNRSCGATRGRQQTFVNK